MSSVISARLMVNFSWDVRGSISHVFLFVALSLPLFRMKCEIS